MRRKQRTTVLFFFLIGGLCICLCGAAGCSGSTGGTGGAAAVLPGAAGHTGQQVGTSIGAIPADPSTPTINDNSSAFVGSWVHTYEYFDTTYHTTLVIQADGSAVYHNEEAELGNYTASWQYSGEGIFLQRNDGVTATAVLQNGVLIEQSIENGTAYTAEYQRGS